LGTESRDRLGHREQPLPRVRLGRDDLLDLLAQPLPHLVQTCEVQVALAPEVTIEDLLADAGGAGDVGRRGASVAAFAEHAQRGVDDRRPALGGRHARWPGRGPHAAAVASLGSRWRTFRTVATAISAPAAAIPHATYSAWW